MPKTLKACCDLLKPGVHAMMADFPTVEDFDLFADLTMDCVRLVVIDRTNRKFTHPQFITRYDIENQSLDSDLLRWRIASTLRGQPGRYPDKTPAISFTLDELNQAQDFIARCNQS